MGRWSYPTGGTESAVPGGKRLVFKVADGAKLFTLGAFPEFSILKSLDCGMNALDCRVVLLVSCEQLDEPLVQRLDRVLSNIEAVDPEESVAVAFQNLLSIHVF